VADELTPREIANEFRTFNKRLERLDNRFNEVMNVLNGAGQQPGMRQQLRELRHYVEGNPPAMRGVIAELEGIKKDHLDLRKDFEEYVETQGKANARRDGTWGGARLVWTLLVTVITIGLGVLGLLLSIYNSVVTRGGS
jgi:hypothetical protein